MDGTIWCMARPGGKLTMCPSHGTIFNSKCTKDTTLGPFLEVGMWKNGTPLWREANFQVKMLKT